MYGQKKMCRHTHIHMIRLSEDFLFACCLGNSQAVVIKAALDDPSAAYLAVRSTCLPVSPRLPAGSSRQGSQGNRK